VAHLQGDPPLNQQQPSRRPRYGGASLRSTPNHPRRQQLMTTSTTPHVGVDNYDWLAAVGQHPETTNVDLLAAYHILGVETDITPERLDESAARLVEFGFLVGPMLILDTEPSFGYRFVIPEAR
jgi:hypothetical protein